MAKPLTLNQNTGTLDTPAKDVIPKRSWRRGDGGYESTFKFDDTTVYIIFPQNWDEVEEAQKVMKEESDQLRQITESYKDKEESEVPEEEKTAIENKVKESLKKQRDFLNKIITECVIGWKGAPFPFSSEERDNLPIQIKAEWLGEIMRVSQLSQAEANFLAK